jgi:hypothetical protein
MTVSTVTRPSFVLGKFDLLMLNDNGDNYKLWSKALTLTLRNCHLWPIVNSTETAPDATADPDTRRSVCTWRTGKATMDCYLLLLVTSLHIGHIHMFVLMFQFCIYSVLLDMSYTSMIT